MDLQLDADPIEFGPSKLNRKTSEVRGHLSKTERIFMEVSHNLQKIKRGLLIRQTEYNIEQTQLIAHDPHVRSGRSQKEREALAGTRLVHIQSKINDLTLKSHDLEDLITVIKAKRTDLKDLQGRLRDQLKLCQEQIALGQRWGTKTMISSDFDNSTGKKSEDTLGDLLETTAKAPAKTLPQMDLQPVQVENISLEDVGTNTDDINLDSLLEDWSN
jgi:hypothetical protein